MGKPASEETEFDIQLKIGKGLRLFFYSQLFVTPPYPDQTFAGQTVIVTGANSGLGLVAAHHFYRLQCARLILAVRTVSKGEAAKESIVGSTRCRTDSSSIEVWPLDLTSTKSTLDFAARVKLELPRVDVVLENAGINPKSWATSEGYERCVQVNVLNTFLLGLDLLPKLNETKIKFVDASPHLVVVSSEAHRLSKFEQINAPGIYERLNTEAGFQGQERYQVSKLIEVLFVRELVARLSKIQQGGTPPVTINLVNPGLCKSELDHDEKNPLLIRLIRAVIDRSTELGGRCLVHAASAASDSHGQFMSDGKNQDVEEWIYQDVGARAQRKVFDQTLVILDQRKPGIAAAVGL